MNTNYPCPSVSDKKHFKMVMLESPYAGDVVGNIEYARLCMRDCLLRGEAPFASHLLYTQENVLDDHNPIDRILGMSAGMSVAERCDMTVVYGDLGISKGMMYGIQAAKNECRPIVYRTLHGGISYDIKGTFITFDSCEGLEMGLKYSWEQMKKQFEEEAIFGTTY